MEVIFAINLTRGSFRLGVNYFASAFFRSFWNQGIGRLMDSARKCHFNSLQETSKIVLFSTVSEYMI